MPMTHRPGPGPLTGAGPAGYHRSDDRICDDVSTRLTLHGSIDARTIEVEVHDADVILCGTVPDRRTRRLAEDVAASVPGVRDIHNQLKVRRRAGPGPSAGERPDPGSIFDQIEQ